MFQPSTVIKLRKNIIKYAEIIIIIISTYNFLAENLTSFVGS